MNRRLFCGFRPGGHPERAAGSYDGLAPFSPQVENAHTWTRLAHAGAACAKRVRVSHVTIGKRSMGVPRCVRLLVVMVVVAGWLPRHCRPLRAATGQGGRSAAEHRRAGDARPALPFSARRISPRPPFRRRPADHGSGALTLQQLVDRRRIVEHVDRPAARVEQLQARVDAEHVVDGGVDVATASAGRVCGRWPRRSVEPTTWPPLTPPPPMQAEHGVAPVVAARACPCCAAAPPLPPSFMRGVRLNSPHSTTSVVSSRPRSSRSSNSAATAAIDLRQVALHAGLQVPVMVPAAEVDGDERRAGLDQPARQQRALAPVVAAVAVAQARVFAVDVERLRGPSGR